MRFDAFGTDEVHAVAAEGSGYSIRTHFTLGFHFPLHLLQFSMDLFHSVDKEGGWQLIWVTLREEGGGATLWAGEGLVGTTCSPGQCLDTPLAVVVKTWKDLWLLEVVLADWARDLLLQFLHSFLPGFSACRHCFSLISLRRRSCDKRRGRCINDDTPLKYQLIFMRMLRIFLEARVYKNNNAACSGIPRWGFIVVLHALYNCFIDKFCSENTMRWDW